MKEKNIVYGLHTIEALLKKHPESIIQLSILKERQDQRMQALISLALLKNIKITWVTRQALDELTHQENHQGIAAHCQKARGYSEHDLIPIIQNLTQPALLLILDGIQDPHNLGACLRSAEGLGAHAVIAPKDKSVGITPTVSKVSSGAALIIPFVQVTNLARTIGFLKEQNIWIYGASTDAEKTLYEADFKGPVGLVLGAEGTGLRRLTKENCDALFCIPLSGSVASLNVSVATGIFLSEVLRQRRFYDA
jgi:23S rRNA (guanosine2251-2'-O)-methyltransferase